jgi:hypothetical protein
MSTQDILIVIAPFAAIWSIMFIGFGIVHYFEQKGN